MNRFVYMVPILSVVLLGGFFIWGLKSDRDPNAIPSELIGQRPPIFDLAELPKSGVRSFSNDDLLASENVSLVNVFASWCVPCRAEHAVLTRIAQDFNINLYGISYKDKPQDAVGWLEELGNPYQRIGADIDGRAGLEWGVAGVPETFVVSADGIVLYRHVGPIVGTKQTKRFLETLRNFGVLEKGDL